jgi:hypothetical protein
MYRIQEVYTMLSVKPGLVAAVVVVTVHFHAANIETVVGSRDRMFGLGTRLPAGRSEVQIQMWERDFCFLQTFLDRLWGLPRVFFNGYREFLSVWSKETWDFTTQVYLVPRLRMSGAVPLLPLYVFMVWTDSTLSLLALLYKTQTMLYIL